MDRTNVPLTRCCVLQRLERFDVLEIPQRRESKVSFHVDNFESNPPYEFLSKNVNAILSFVRNSVAILA